MAMPNRTVVVGVFSDPTQAGQAVEELHRSGFGDDQIGFARKGEGEQVESGHAAEGSLPGKGTGTQAGGTAAKGVVIGGILGAAAALLIPGVGPVIAGGILGPILGGATAAGVGAAGAVAGGAVGGIVGALTGLGIPEQEAEYYQGQLEQGRTLVTVKAVGRYDEARSILHRFGAYDIQDQGTATTDTMPTTPTSSATIQSAQSQTMPLREERLDVGKRTQQAGEVRLGKDVVEQQRTVDVPVSREEVYVEQHPVDRPLEPGEKPFTGETISVPLTREDVTVDKQTQVYGEVEVGKRQVTEQQRISETVRREEPVIEKTGNVSMGQTWTEALPQWRSYWQSRYGTQGGRWEDVSPYYQWGYTQYNDPRYQGRSYSQIEPQLRSSWESQHPDTPWDKVKNFIQDIWNRRPGSMAA